MLVLTRKLGEQIEIDGCIEVTVLGVEGHRVRLGIQAPPEVTIRRGELVFDLGSHTDAESELFATV